MKLKDFGVGDKVKITKELYVCRIDDGDDLPLGVHEDPRATENLTWISIAEPDDYDDLPDWIELVGNEKTPDIDSLLDGMGVRVEVTSGGDFMVHFSENDIWRIPQKRYKRLDEVIAACIKVQQLMEKQ